MKRTVLCLVGLTEIFSTLTEGLAVAYSKKIRLIPTPTTIPISKRKNKQQTKVVQAGIRSDSVKLR
jgi:hypothetical protein